MKVHLGPYRTNRKIEIRIDKYDVWGLDHTLALIIHPALVLLKEQKHGDPQVDDEDVPEELRSTAAEPTENEWDTDDNWVKRWDWVLDEMIWTFEQCTYDDRGDSQFHHNSDQLDINFDVVLNSELKSLKINQQKDPSKPAYWVDEEGKIAHYNRIAAGLKLFSKYYFALWD
jgi:hypothetical protein